MVQTESSRKPAVESVPNREIYCTYTQVVKPQEMRRRGEPPDGSNLIEKRSNGRKPEGRKSDDTLETSKRGKKVIQDVGNTQLDWKGKSERVNIKIRKASDSRQVQTHHGEINEIGFNKRRERGACDANTVK